MKKVILAFALLGCGRTPVVPPMEGAFRIPIKFHVMNDYDAKEIVPRMIQETNRGLQGQMFLSPVEIEKEKDMPASVEAASLSYDDFVHDGFVHVYLHSHVGWVSHEGVQEVAGMVATHENDMCQRKILLGKSHVEFQVLLHEMGHFYGLRHVEDPSNIMNSDRYWNASLSRKQLLQMRKIAEGFQDFCLSFPPS